MSESRARPVSTAAVVAVAAAAALPLPTGPLFGATGWDLESEVVLIIGRTPRIEQFHLAIFLSRQTPGEETSRKAEVGIKRPPLNQNNPHYCCPEQPVVSTVKKKG